MTVSPRRSRWRYYLRSLPTLARHVSPRARIAASLIGLAPRPFHITLSNGLRFRVRDAMDVWIIKETCLDHEYDRGTLLRDQWTIIDIGAGLGDFTVYAARRCPNGRIFAFEPAPQSFALLQANLGLNGVANVQALPVAIGGGNATLTLDQGSGVPVLYRASSDVHVTHTGAIQVTAMKLDDVFERYAIAHCDFLKMDCEGAEYEILFATAPATLRKIRRLCLEYHDNATAHAHPDLVAFLTAHGFAVECTPNPAYEQIGLLHATLPDVA